MHHQAVPDRDRIHPIKIAPLTFVSFSLARKLRTALLTSAPERSALGEITSDHSCVRQASRNEARGEIRVIENRTCKIAAIEVAARQAIAGKIDAGQAGARKVHTAEVNTALSTNSAHSAQLLAAQRIKRDLDVVKCRMAVAHSGCRRRQSITMKATRISPCDGSAPPEGEHLPQSMAQSNKPTIQIWRPEIVEQLRKVPPSQRNLFLPSPLCRSTQHGPPIRRYTIAATSNNTSASTASTSARTSQFCVNQLGA